MRRNLRIAVAGWTGSGNVGDELLFDVLNQRLRELDTTPVLLSVNPAASSRLHDVEVVDAFNLSAITRCLCSVDGLVFGPGGLLQDTTSTRSLPGHLGRVVLARRLGVRTIGLGLGAVPLRRPYSPQLVRLGLRSVDPIVVRDQNAASVLRSAGVGDITVSADLAFWLVSGSGDSGVGHRVGRGEIALVPRHSDNDRAASWWVDAAAQLCAATAFGVRLMGLDPRDGEILGAVRRGLEQRGLGRRCHLVAVDHHNLVEQIGACRAVLSARYHGVVAGVLSSRPAVAVGFKPDIAALVDQIGDGAAVVAHDRAGLGVAANRLIGLLDSGATTGAARERLGVAADIADRALVGWLDQLPTSVRGSRHGGHNR